MSIYGLFKVLSFNVPFVFLALEFLIGKEFVPCLVGLVVGHLHYYLQVRGAGVCAGITKFTDAGRFGYG